MKCQRCGGIMVPEEFYSLDDERFSGWRCIFCGEIIDPVILRNRKAQKLRAIPSEFRIRHYGILTANDASGLGMPEWPQE